MAFKCMKILSVESLKMSYKVYQFVSDNSIAALPIEWIKDGMVQFGSNATHFIASRKKPLKNWKLYKVAPVDDKIYDNYKSALKAEIILTEQSEIDTSEYERILLPDDSSLPLSKRKIKSVAKVTYMQSSDESSDESEGMKIPKIPAVSVKRYKSCHDATSLLSSYGSPMASTTATQSETSVTTANDVFSVGSKNGNVSDTLSHTITLNQHSIAGAPGVISSVNEQEIPQNYGDTSTFAALINYNDVETNIKEILRTVVKEELKSFRDLIREDIRTIIKEEMNVAGCGIQRPNLKIGLTEFETENGFSLNTIEDLQLFDEKISADSNLCSKLRTYLTQIGGRHAKDHIKVINRIYSLHLQQKISYTGREHKKFAVKNLFHIKILIEILMENYSNLTERTAISLVQKYLQQTCDRVRAFERKNRENESNTACEENGNTQQQSSEQYTGNDEEYK